MPGLCRCSVFRGARGYRRVLAILLVTLLGGLVAVLVDSALLPSADSGLELLLKFDWDALLNVEVSNVSFATSRKKQYLFLKYIL